MAVKVLIILGSIVFSFRLLFFFHDMEQMVRGKTGWWIINFLNALLALMISTIALVTFDVGDADNTCPPVDGAFGGVGTRVGLWITVGFILLQWFIGAWTSIHIGSKAMATGLLIGNIAIFLCLILQQAVGQLSFTDMVIGSMVIDVQGSTLLNQLAMKETLASVWMVGTILIVGFVSLIEIGILIGTAGTGPWQQCKLFYFDAIQAGGALPTLFWLYYITRWLAYITTSLRAIRCILDFFYCPEISKSEVVPGSFEAQVAATFPETESPAFKALAGRRREFFSYHGTVDYFGAENFVFAVCVIFNFERSVKLVGHDSLDSFGQEMGLVIAIMSVLSAVFGALRAAEYPKRFWQGSIFSLGVRNQVAQEMEQRLGKTKDSRSLQTNEPKDAPMTPESQESSVTANSASLPWIQASESVQLDIPEVKPTSEGS